MRGPWRIKALPDKDGHAVINTYSTVRPHDGGPPVMFLWALLNSPIANAFVYCNALKRHIYDTLVARLPLPEQCGEHVGTVVATAEEYLRQVREPKEFRLQAEDYTPVREALLKMDAAVMRAYDLPPRLERQLLDLFQGVERKGVGCQFSGYYPPGFSSYLPLHFVISDRFQRAAADRTAERFKPGESDYVRTVLRVASEAFDEE